MMPPLFIKNFLNKSYSRIRIVESAPPPDQENFQPLTPIRVVATVDSGYIAQLGGIGAAVCNLQRAPSLASKPRPPQLHRERDSFK